MPIPSNLRRKRRQIDPSMPPRGTDMALGEFAVNANKLRFDLPEQPSIKGLPQWGMTGGVHVGTEYPTGIAIISPTRYELTYAHNVAAGDQFTIPDRDACFRNRSGGYVIPGSYTMP